MASAGTVSTGLDSETILDILRLILSGTSLREVLMSVARVVEAQREGMLCAVWLLDPDRIHMRAIAAPNLPESYIRAIDGGSWGAAVNRREPVFVTDVLTDPVLEQVRDIIASHGLRACWSAPIISQRGEILGTFAFYFRSVQTPSPSDLQLIESATRIAGIAIELDDLKRAEAKLRLDEEELRRITDLISQAIIVLNPDGKAIYANRACLEYSGLSLEDVRGADFRDRVFHPEDVQRLREERGKALLSNVPFENEQRARGKDGKYRWFLIRYNPFLDESGTVIRWYATGTDIEDRKRAEDQLHKENIALREEINHISMFEEIVGSSEALRRVLSQVSKVAPSDSTVLITGESGTGKELIARAIHKRSKRAGRAFIGVNCAAIPGSLIASELFGHEKGAFTGATQRRQGRFEAANGGTIFLDEIGDLPPDIQIALLRVVQEREIERVGSNTPIPVDVRVLAATHRDLAKLVSEGKFRQDLLYRLNVVPIEMPSLRERLSDIPLLVEYFIARFGRQAAKKFRRIDKKTLQLLEAYEWPGNVRELQNVIERAVILSDSDTFAVDETWLKGKPSETSRSTPDLTGALLKQEREMIEAALAESSGRISGPEGAAARLRLPSRTLDSKIKRLGIDKYRFKVRT